MQIYYLLNLVGDKKHIDQTVPKLSTACFAVKRLFPILNIDFLRMVC